MKGIKEVPFKLKKHDLSQTSKGIKIVQFKGRKSTAWGKPRPTVGGGAQSCSKCIAGNKALSYIRGG